MHPSHLIKETKSKKLRNKKIVLALTGGIACVECVKLARELIRHGASITAIMSKEACRILNPMAMEFATGNEVITELSGKVEHVHEYDLLLIAPCTANTISKISMGIADNVVTTFALTAKKIAIAPSMHLSMYKNKIIQENLEKCKRHGIKIIEPKIEENKAKMASIQKIVKEVIRIWGDKKGKKVLIIGGSTFEAIDDVRGITNLSSGKMAKALVNEAYERGMDVTLWASFPYENSVKFVGIKDLINLIKNCSTKYDAVINCAAISDFIVEKKEGKIKSGKEISLALKPAPRINPLLKKLGKIVIGFKLEEKEEDVIEKSMKRLKEDGIDFIIGNTIESIGKDVAKAWIINKDGLIKKIEGRKKEIAKEIIDLI